MRILPRIQQYLFPHISRIFSAVLDSASFRYSIFALCMAIVLTNVWMKMILPADVLTARINLLTYPFSMEKHIQFGEQLYAMGNRKEAEYEVTLAEQLSVHQQTESKNTSAVLGTQSAPGDVLRRWDIESERLNNLYIFWSRIVVEKPDYRDAYLTLATLAQTMNKNEEAKTYLHQAYSLDPNNQQIRSFESSLGISH